MRAAVQRAFGDPSAVRIEDWPEPLAGPREVVVRVEAVTLNRTDVHVLERTNIGRSVELPHIGGLDPAGVVAAIGDGVDGLAIGDPVVAKPMIACTTCRFCLAADEAMCERPSYVGVHRPGGFAQAVALPARAVFRRPDGLDAVHAATTAHSVPVVVHLLDTVGAVGPADVVVIVGAAGGLGIAAVQVAARVLGARTIAAVGDPAKGGRLSALGADAVVSYADPSGLGDRIRAAAGDRAPTVVVDNVGDPALWPELVGSLDKGGRVLSCGAHAGGVVALDLSLFYRMQLRLLSTAGSSAAEFRRALDLVADGTIEVEPHVILPLDAIGRAFEELKARRNTGKIVLRIGS
jgi:NADPH:quinone reductase-like Zn-dependent oxidoreductase